SFHGLSLHSDELPSESPLFTAKTVVAELKPLSLFRRKLLLRSLEWDQAVVRLSTSLSGSKNVSGPRLSSFDKLVDLSIDRLVLGHTSLYLNDRRLAVDLEAGDVAILLHFDRRYGYSGTLASRQTVVHTPYWSL